MRSSSKSTDSNPFLEWVTPKKIIVAVALFFLFILFFASWRNVDAGHVGVLKWFGDVQEGTLDPGPHLILPFYSVVEVSYQRQEEKETVQFQTNDGLTAAIDISFIFHADPLQATRLVDEYGIDVYVNKIVLPNCRSISRDALAEFTMDALYNSNRTKVSQEIMNTLRPELKKHGVVLLQVLLRRPQLPQQVKDAIERKMKSQQEAEAMEFVLQREEQIKRQRLIEAQGLAEAQREIANGLTPAYLQWYYINTLKDLIDSPNNTILIMPMDQKIFPVMKKDGEMDLMMPGAMPTENPAEKDQDD